ncbi:MAG: TatD family hydrolase [Prevotella sp.]|jgi:TatD DNase family protein|nr:TatD family hydrolase [Prevotella sp.]MCI1282013.1 TatD family hydrolase [Prevotella sp.]
MKPLYIDTHAHLDGEEFRDDLPDVILRAREAGVSRIFLPAINLASIASMQTVCHQYPHYLYPMIGLQPEEVKADWQKVLCQMKAMLSQPSVEDTPYIAIGECGLDFYWSREFENEQLAAFEEQVRWSVEYQLPLVIHCRKAQNELLHIMKPYANDLPGGIFHCFTGNQKEAQEYLKFDRFCLGIGGVSTFKSSHLREDLPASVPLNRIVLETDSPYMAPVPHRGERNESAFLIHVLHQLAESYGVNDEEIANQTNQNVERLFGRLE